MPGRLYAYSLPTIGYGRGNFAEGCNRRSRRGDEADWAFVPPRHLGGYCSLALSFRAPGLALRLGTSGRLWLAIRSSRNRRFGRRSFLVNDLPNLVEFLFDACFGSLEARLAQIDCVSKQRTPGMDALRIAAFLQLDSFVLQELADVFIKLVFLYWIHNRFNPVAEIRKLQSALQLQRAPSIVTNLKRVRCNSNYFAIR